jgi:membrane protein implicated in regulation of membrane protease activity
MVAIIWLVLGVVLLAIEMRHLAFYALFGAAGCLAAAVTAVFVPDAIPVQIAVFVAVAAIGILAVRPMMSQRFHTRMPSEPLGKGVAGTLVGEEVLTLDEVGDIHHLGHVRLAGERWLAASASGASIPAGSKVVVTSVEGTTLVVWPVNSLGMIERDPTPQLPTHQPTDPSDKEHP